MAEDTGLISTSETVVRLSRITNALDLNLYGDVHGGAVLRFIDEAAGVVACRFMEGQMSTVAVDSVQFIAPVHPGDVITCVAQVNWSSRSSCEVGAKVTAQPWDRRRGPARHVATAYLVFVAIGEDGRPMPVPGITPDSREAERRYREAAIRRESRKAYLRAIESSRASAQ